MNVTVYGPTGQKTGTLILPKELFESKINPSLLAQAVKVYRTRARQGTKKTKTRGEVAGSTIKIYRQKGTGRARHGARYAPIFVGGGIAHGPTGNEQYTRHLNSNQKRQALISALSIKAKDKQIVVVDKLETVKPKTRLMHQLLSTIIQKETTQKPNKYCLILAAPIKSVILATRNVPHTIIRQARQLTAYDVLNGGVLIFAKPSIDSLKQTLTAKAQSKN